MSDKNKCSLCGETKPPDLFKKAKSRKDGHSSWCKACHSQSVRGYQKTPQGRQNKLRNHAKFKRTAKGMECDRRYKQGEAGRAAIKRYTSGPAGRIAGARHSATRRARMKLVTNDLTAQEWLEILKQQNYKCKICGITLDGAGAMTLPQIDHIVPLMWGGPLTKLNVQALCRPCNSHKWATVRIPQHDAQMGLGFVNV